MATDKVFMYDKQVRVAAQIQLDWFVRFWAYVIEKNIQISAPRAQHAVLIYSESHPTLA